MNGEPEGKGTTARSKPCGLISGQWAQRDILGVGDRRHSFPNGTLQTPAFRPSATTGAGSGAMLSEHAKTLEQESTLAFQTGVGKLCSKIAKTQKTITDAQDKEVVRDLNPDRTRKLNRQIDAGTVQFETKQMALQKNAGGVG